MLPYQIGTVQQCFWNFSSRDPEKEEVLERSAKKYFIIWAFVKARENWTYVTGLNPINYSYTVEHNTVVCLVGNRTGGLP